MSMAGKLSAPGIALFSALLLIVVALSCDSGPPEVTPLPAMPASTVPIPAVAQPDTPVPVVPTVTVPAPAHVITPTPVAKSTATTTPRPTYTRAPVAEPTATTAPRPTDTPTPVAEPTAAATPRPTDTPWPTRRPAATVQPTLAPGTMNTPRPTTALEDLANGKRLEAERPALAGSISDLPWVADDITESERAAAQALVNLAARYEGVFSILMLKPWILDGIDRDELTSLQNLYWMAQGDEVAAEKVANQPFMDSVKPPDTLALVSLRQLAWRDPDELQRIIAHPNMSDGISDDEAKVVALLAGTSAIRPETVAALLSPNRIYVEERTVSLPLSGETLLAIIRIRDKRTDRMDLLEHSVRAIETFIAEPLPSNYIALLFDDATIYELGGTHFGTHIAMSLLYDVESGDLEETVGHVIAHEVAHYYFGTPGRDWIHEGAADFLASVSENSRTGQPVAAINDPCTGASTIAKLESLDAKIGSNEFRCNYALGEALFLDLYDSLGNAAFRQGIRNLYLKSQDDDSTDVCLSIRLNVCHLKAAFQEDATAQTAAMVEDIVTRHYYGAAARSISPPDTVPVVPDLPHVGGYLDEAYLALDKDRRRATTASVISARDIKGEVYIFIEGFRGKSQHQQVLPLEYVGYFEDGSTFLGKEVAFILEPPRRSFGYWIPVALAARPGRYWVYVYSESQKVAQLEFEVVP